MLFFLEMSDSFAFHVRPLSLKSFYCVDFGLMLVEQTVQSTEVKSTTSFHPLSFPEKFTVIETIINFSANKSSRVVFQS